jgi:hypothetical protein
MFFGISRSPSMSSEKAMIREEILGAMDPRACRTNDVRATSPKVPMCGRPDGP